ncbi:hypothetical protein [Pseudonocardia phyllosphaerae]|uniref:hypothetical protein n=1 Tax=Pseudonocardia phyllosphaerae TaxID=3390502 RepID=UPI0039782BDB
MTTPDAAGTAGAEDLDDTRAVPTEQSDTPVDETPDGDGVHLGAQPVDTGA